MVTESSSGAVCSLNGGSLGVVHKGLGVSFGTCETKLDRNQNVFTLFFGTAKTKKNGKYFLRCFSAVSYIYILHLYMKVKYQKKKNISLLAKRIVSSKCRTSVLNPMEKRI